jgi:hypothetical protein
MGITRQSRVEVYDNKYTKEKVLLAKDYVDNHKYRNQDLKLLLEIYSKVKGVSINQAECKSCGIQKYYVGLQNYVNIGTIILAKQGITLDDVQPEVEDTSNRIDLGHEIPQEIVEIEQEIKEEPASQITLIDPELKTVETIITSKKTYKKKV